MTQQNKWRAIRDWVMSEWVRGCAALYMFPFEFLAGIYYFFDRRHQVPAFQPCTWNLHLQALQCNPGVCVSIGNCEHTGCHSDSVSLIVSVNCDNGSRDQTRAFCPILLCFQERKKPCNYSFYPVKSFCFKNFFCKEKTLLSWKILYQTLWFRLSFDL